MRLTLQAELAAARQKEANLQAQVAEGVLEAVELRRQLHAARAAADPNIIQVSCEFRLLCHLFLTNRSSGQEMLGV